MSESDKVQQSNYGKNSFQLTNTGVKKIVQFELDVTDALFPDIVFDPEGVAGDSVAKALEINRNDSTGLIPLDEAREKPYLGDGGSKGYKGLRLTFDPSRKDGFNPGETIGFSIDMDPNSIAGTEKSPIDRSSSPRWDVGGVSGAEMIGSSFAVVFEDGSTASGQLFSNKNQAGSLGIAREQQGEQNIQLIANQTLPGQTGKYSNHKIELFIKGAEGSRVRVVLAKGFIQPVRAYSDFLEQQLAALSREDFPANNAVEFQFVDVEMTGETMELSEQFDLYGVADYNFAADSASPFSINEDELPLAITAAVIDKDGMPAGPVTKPIYLTHQ